MGDPSKLVCWVGASVSNAKLGVGLVGIPRSLAFFLQCGPTETALRLEPEGRGPKTLSHPELGRPINIRPSQISDRKALYLYGNLQANF
jgi:hypothetical protein